MHLINIYQHRTLAEIALAIERSWLDPETVTRFSQWLHLEEPPNAIQYEADKEAVGLAWHRRFDDGHHEAMCRLPRCVTAASQQDIQDQGSSWPEAYGTECQFVFSRVQEHVHQKTKKGLIPLRACLSSRCRTKCKHGFPKRCFLRCTVICNGNYRRLGVRISGRRNALGCILGRRTMEYQSGTLRGFAVATGSNTHTAPNYRLPPNAATHDPDCKNAYCLAAMAQDVPAQRRPQLLRLCKVLYRASQEMSGYYLGYSFKGQPVGKKALKLVDKSFEYLVGSLGAVPEHARFRHTAIRTMVNFHHSTTSRPATEETLLSMFVDDHDVKNAEFLRLYVNVDFHGSCLLGALERAMALDKQTIAEETRHLPKIAKDIEDKAIMLQHFDQLYGCRPSNDEIYYLNAWEFIMWWRVAGTVTCFKIDRRGT